MKKICLIFLLLPVLSFSQVDLASWAFTANGNATSPGYTATYNAAGGNRTFSASGLLYGNNGDGGFQQYNYIEVAITPTSGMVNVTSLNFSHARAANGGNLGSTNYTVKYFVVLNTDPAISDANFYNLGTTVVNDELISANPNKSIAINRTLTSSQKLIVRLYPRGGQWDNNAGWRINANTMKFRGTQLGPLAGTYYINSASTPNFPSLSDAASAINALGMSAPVTFLLDNNTLNAASGETFPIVFTQFTGTSATNTLTIKPNVGRTPTITATTSNLASVFKIDGADNIIFDGSNTTNGTTRDWTISNSGTSDIHKTVFWIASNAANAATNIKISNTTIVFGSRPADYRVLAGIYSGNTTTLGVPSTPSTSVPAAATAANSKLVFTNNAFSNVLQGIYVGGSATAGLKTNDVTISSNTIGTSTDATKPAMGIQLMNVDNFNITDNNLVGLRLATNQGYETVGGIFIDGGNTFTIKRNILSDINYSLSNATVLYGMSVRGTVVNGVISENKITNLKNTGATNVRGLDLQLNASTSSDLQVYNNVIADISGAGSNNLTLRGVSIGSGKAIKLYHNSVVLTGTPGGSSISVAMYIDGGTELDIRDNIFGNQSSGSPFAIYSTVANTAFTDINYNDYFSSGTLGFLGSARNTIAAWRTATGKDANSLNVVPSFSTTDLRLTYPNTVNATLIGTSLISTDYDATVRTIPTMGAYEYRLRCTGTTTTWNGTAWSNGTPTSTSPVIINGNYTTGTNGNINACELTVNAGFILTISSGGSVKVENGITTAGTTSKIIVQNNASLIQVDDTAAATSPGLNVTVIRTSTPLKYYDYTYWSSPVVGAILDTVSAPSLFYEWNASVLNTGQWVNLSWAYVMLPGSGYIARAPTNLDWANNPTVTATFNGRVNSGVINKTIYLNGTSVNNLIGNPYPSALDAKAFLIANQANISGNLYFWTHQTAISGQAGEIQTYTSDDYAVYNLTGSVGTGKGNTGTNGEVVANRPNGQIASGQAFFVEALNNNVNVQFTNAMRTSTTNNQFFKTAPTKTAQGETVDNSRVWLSLTNEQGAYAETLVGYIEDATNDLDNLFDAMKYDGGNYVSVYSLIGSDKLVIQGRGLPFSDSDIVPLGYNSTVAGTFKISLEEFDGLFMGQDVYLLDKLTDVSTKLNDGAYTFTTEIGTFNNRFELRYTNATLGVDNPIATNGVVIFTKANHIEVKSDMQDIQSIAIYDLLGRSIYANDKINAVEFSTKELGFHSQVVIVKVKMADNSELTKKVILK